MKINGIFIVILVLAFSAYSDSQSEQKGNLTVRVTGLESEEGKVLIALCGTPKEFETSGEPNMGGKAIIKNEQAIWTYEALSFGTYAVKVFHDEDDDNEFDTNFLGIPTEDYGFSNNAKGTFGPASWDDAKFLFESEKDTVNINLD